LTRFASWFRTSRMVCQQVVLPSRPPVLWKPSSVR